ncbi:exosortase family protein XrtF [Chryseobacterium gotjawalense]|uniref:Exosortase family protein XrtF n=1 Tax=Chryseobacterium gotjawalense TaxID=3042315 RepID=A0ABY8RCL8_9FLAO|nr:exosortase family protein XrtF [Chryseobacterium sp. wdc7]WHF50952.1 exosortase family protein XrtF [Chryseobacterium sp. wdc7]
MFNDFKPVLKILLRFIILYVVLVLGYQFYLNGFKNAGLDSFSTWVMTQVDFLQNLLGYPSQMIAGKPQQETTWFFVSGRYVSRMVEGCNAISVMILFLAFIFAFYEGFKTFIFAALGVIFLHIMNVLRIVGLNIVLVEHPQYSKIGHDYLFPAIIYGSVVLLWLIWIKFYALKEAKDESA